MRRLVYLGLVLTLTGHAASAKLIKPGAAGKEKGITDLRRAIEIENKPAEQFHYSSQLVGKYASVNITEVMKADARKAAEALLEISTDFKKDWDYGNAVHHAHLVLGRLDLIAGKLDAAKGELKLAGQTPGSPQLNSFGPNMTLARELLEKGEKTVVLDYFRQCLKFWKSPYAKPAVAKWKMDIEQGRAPDFGANLVY